MKLKWKFPFTPRVIRATSLLVVVLITLAGIEGAARLAARVRPLTNFQGTSGVWWVANNPDWEVWHVPNTRVIQESECYRAINTSNSFGMRDKARSLRKEPHKPRVAVLGDSFTEGWQVNDSEVFTRVLEHQEFHDTVEFLNFGIADFGTIQEWVQYEHLVRSFHPDLVLLMFYEGNDLTDNSWWFWQRFWQSGGDAPHHRPLFRRVASGYELFYPAPFTGTWLGNSWWPTKKGGWNSWRNQLHRQLTFYSYAIRYLDRIRYLLSEKRRLQSVKRAARSTEPDAKERAARGAEPDAKNWDLSWEFTQEALRRLHQAVRADGARLIVVHIPDPFVFGDPSVSPDWGWRPNIGRRLAQIAAHLEGASFFSLLGPFMQYRDAHHLGPPYFSYSCDRHWSPLGHRVAAQGLAGHLIHSDFFHGKH